MRHAMRGPPRLHARAASRPADLYRTAHCFHGARNSTRIPSPMVLTMRPVCCAMIGSTSSPAQRLKSGECAFLVCSHELTVANHIGREDGASGVGHVPRACAAIAFGSRSIENCSYASSGVYSDKAPARVMGCPVGQRDARRLHTRLRLQNSMCCGWGPTESFGWPPSRAPDRGVANLHRQHPPDVTPTLSKAAATGGARPRSLTSLLSSARSR